MFRQDFDSSPFKRNRLRQWLGAFPRWISRIMDARARHQMNRVKSRRLARFMGKLNAFFYWTGRAIVGLFDTLLSPFRRVARFMIFEPLHEWQLAREERANREARVNHVNRALRAIRSRVGHAMKWMEQHPFFRWIARPIVFVAKIPGRLASSFVRLYDRLEKRLSESKWLYGLYCVLATIRYLASSIYEFFRSWCFTRDYRQLIGGLPAIVLVLPLIFCLIRVPLYSATAKARHYSMAAKDARDAGDLDAARLYYRKVQQIGISVESALFQSALSAGEEGDYDEAFVQMQQVVEQYDFPPAKLWMVQTLLSNRLKNPPANAGEICDRYLREILTLDNNNPFAVVLRAQRLAQQNQPTEAIALLRTISRDYPPANLLISEMERSRNNYADAGATLRKTLEYYESRFASKRSLDTTDFDAWLSAILMSGDYQRLIEIGSVALERHADDRQLRETIVDRFGMASDFLMGNTRETETCVELLKRALEMDPGNEATLERVALLVNDPRVGSQAEQLLEQDNLKLPANVHAALAMSACARYDFATARGHFQIVANAYPKSGEAANNLAWVLMQTDPVELERALELADKATRLEPSSAAFRETRGQILVKMGRWQEAIDDLRWALNGLPEEVGIHESLAKAYEQVGEPSLAEAHRGQIRALKSSRTLGVD